MRVLLTGHKGYIGTVLGPLLLEHGHEVVGLDTDLYERCTFTDMASYIDGTRKDVRDIQKDDVEGI